LHEEKSRMLSFARLALALVVVAGLCGCGGGGGGGTDWFPIDDPQAIDVLRDAGLTCTLETDKDTYQEGETVHFWVSVRNDSSRAHTLEAHVTGVRTPTYYIGVWGGNPNGFGAAWGEEHYDTPTWQIEPGQTLRIFDIQWNQVTTSGHPVGPGAYGIETTLVYVWLDGKAATPLPLSVGRRITIQ
jgi:hypothetical protein